MMHFVPCIFTLFSACSSEKGEYGIDTCKICAKDAVKASIKHHMF